MLRLSVLRCGIGYLLRQQKICIAREREGKSASAPDHATYPNRAAMLFNNALGNRQTKTVTQASGTAFLPNPVKYTTDVFFRDSDPGVLYAKRDQVAFVAPLYGHPSAFGREFQSVAD
jgi:hypothetical protein